MVNKRGKFFIGNVAAAEKIDYMWKRSPQNNGIRHDNVAVRVWECEKVRERKRGRKWKERKTGRKKEKER
jgi:hypothetical protein